jgi:hypothetical protein
LSIASNIINIIVLIIQRYSFITTLFLGPFDDVITKFYCIIIVVLQPFVGSWLIFQFLDPIHKSVGLLGRGTSPLQDLYLHTEQYKLRIHTIQTSIPWVGFEPPDLSVRESEDGSCLRPRGHRDRLLHILMSEYFCYWYVLSVFSVTWVYGMCHETIVWKDIDTSLQ